VIQYTFAVTLPIYLGIALGYVAVRFGWIQPSEVKALGRFTVVIGVPALLFRSISHQSLGALLNLDYLAVYALGSLSTMGIVSFVATQARGRSLSLAGLQGLGASNSNSLFIGYPIAVQVLGPVAGGALALCMLVENILVIPLGLALADSSNVETRRGPLSIALSNLRSLSRNPMILAIFAGLAFSALGLHLPEVLDKSISMVASATSPMALFVIGGSLVGLKLDGLRSDLGIIVAGKLVLHPLCVCAWLLLFPPDEPMLCAAAVLFAAMPMMSIYPVLAHRYGQERLCSAALLAATVVSFVSISVVIALLPMAWLPIN
jgi:malonate transporter and related proteins